MLKVWLAGTWTPGRAHVLDSLWGAHGNVYKTPIQHAFAGAMQI
jgi:hypothetical protein